MIIAFVLALVTVSIDQLTKFFLYGKSFSLIGDFLWIESPELNTGASFGIFKDNTLVLAIISIPMIIFMIYVICSKKVYPSIFFKSAVGILLGGTIGNLIDRLVFKGVRDFIYFKSINFAIFNFADIFINVGVYMIIIYLIIDLFKKDKNKQKKQETSSQDKE